LNSGFIGNLRKAYAQPRCITILLIISPNNYLLFLQLIAEANSMKVGLVLPHLSAEATKESIEKIAVGAENEGFDSLWVAERLLWPINPQTPYPATEDGSLPTFYQRVFDPLETLTFVAGKTERIALGTSVIDMLFHNPVVLAKRFATLDVLSDGRAICGLGIGWSKD
jgi:alkanesulfonate monooxygenase SsuD/methylene tetrahydromethanopterin reductase-like flavin-dependent oxidoreductase (luciferase family)